MAAKNNGQHILVVEDEEHLATGIRFNLEAEGYCVTTAGDGPQALNLFKKDADDVDLVILDIMLPGMSGYAVCETIRSSGSDVPVLMLSARTLAEDRTRGFDVGADQYLTKPFDLDELLSRVKALISRYRTTGTPSDDPDLKEYCFANAVVNFETFQVTVDGKNARLTQLEMKLLRYFVENRQRVIPRQELLEEVWGMPGHLQTRAPDQFIRRLRKLFEPNPAKPIFFLTIRDAGYRFVPDGRESAED